MDLRRYNWKYFKHKMYDSFIRKKIRSIIDCERIKKKYPELQNTYEAKKNDYKHKILPFYKHYVSDVSNEIMAISLELIVFCVVICDIIKPEKILDLGSGFSSFVFRYMPSILNQNYRPIVLSVDDSQEWLEKTRRFITSHSISCNNLITWEELIQQDSNLFDFILYDIGEFPFRMEILEQTLKFANANGVMIIDDMHSAEFGHFVQKVLNRNKISFFDLRYYTIDRLNRYSLLVTL